jgi:hypothetical protein
VETGNVHVSRVSRRYATAAAIRANPRNAQLLLNLLIDKKFRFSAAHNYGLPARFVLYNGKHSGFRSYKLSFLRQFPQEQTPWQRKIIGNGWQSQI